MKPRHFIFLFLGAITILRLIYIAQVELVADESYYYMWSQRLDFSYYSKGPGVAFAIRLGTMLFGPNEFGVRFLSPILSLGTSLILYFFARRIYNESVAVWTVLTMNAMPIFNVGSLVMTIDPLSIFFWAAALYTFWLALEKSPGFNWQWPFTGLLIGLGFLAKYTNAMQLLSIVLILACTRKYRGEFKRAGFYSLLAVFLVCTLPVIIWNKNHAWITLVHLSARGGLNSGFALHPTATLEFLGAQLGVYSPLICVGLIMALWWARHDAMVKFKPRFLVLFSLPLLAMYLFLALKKSGQPNWTAPGFVSLGVLASALWHEFVQQRPAWKKYVVSALALGIVISFALLSTEILRSAGVPISYKIDPSGRLRGWSTTASVVDDYRKQFEKETGKPAFLIGNKYQTSALLSFYLPEKRIEGPGHPAVYIPESQDIESEFSFWPSYDECVIPSKADEAKYAEQTTEEDPAVNPFMGRNALYITDAIDNDPPSALQRGFERVELVKIVEIKSQGLPLRQIRIFTCYNYKTVSL